MKVFGQLEKAQLENTTSDTVLAAAKGVITYRTDLNQAKISNGAVYKLLIDEDSTQTISNKTYASPITSGAITSAQTTTPTNPSSGSNKLYFKADGKLYTLDAAGNEALVGSGSGGVKNLVVNGNADDSASSIFIPYANAASTRPTTGTGGSPTVTTSVTTVTPLDGIKSYLLIKPASNVQGQGWAVPFNVDPAYRSKQLKISADYIINSGTFVPGTPSIDGDLIWTVYDVTNSQLLEPTNIKMFSNSTIIADKFEATFQSSATGSAYRLIAHVATTSALAFEIEIDNITVSPQSSVNTTTTRGPIASIIAYSSLTPPTGYLYCNGQTVSRTTYQRLFAIIGTTYGAGDGSTTFHVPDFRGRFLRGVDQGVNRDPDRASRTAMNSGGAAGDAVGSTQTDTFLFHNHTGATGFQSNDHQHIGGFAGQNSGGSYGVTTAPNGNINQQAGQSPNDHPLTSGVTANHNHAIQGEGGSETRPENANIAYHICFDDGSVQVSDTVVWADDVGQVQAFAFSSATPPTGWLAADGTAVSRATYADLFRKIGTTFGVGNGSTTFNLPDLRGIFIRGAGSQSFGAQTYSGTLGTKQNDSFESHGHSITQNPHLHTYFSPVSQIDSDRGSGGSNWSIDGSTNYNTSSANADITIQNTGGSETQPANIALTYFIKFVRGASPVINLTERIGGTVTSTAGQAILANTVTKLVLGTIEDDTLGAWSIADNDWTIRQSARYEFTGAIKTALTSVVAGNIYKLDLFVDNVLARELFFKRYEGAITLEQYGNFSCPINLNSGQKVDIRMTSTVATTVNTTAGVNQFTYKLLK